MFFEILHAFTEYKKLSAAFAVAVVLMIFFWVLAARSIAKRNRERDAILQKLQKEQALRQKFADLTAEKALQADSRELVHGLAAQIQSELEKEPDLDAAFRALCPEKQHIYALNFLLCEDAQTLSQFFRLNGKPLTDAALAAARAMFDAHHLPLMEQAYRMFDDDDETTSALAEDIAALDTAFAQCDDALFDAIRQYITENAQVFEYHLEG